MEEPTQHSLQDMSVAAISSASNALMKQSWMKTILEHFQERVKNDPKFKWVVIGGTLYLSVRLLNLDSYTFPPITKFCKYIYKKVKVPESLIYWAGYIEPDIPFGSIGYTRCLESDTDVLEKFGIPMNAEKCIRDGISFVPGEFYQRFDLNEYDPKVTPMTWSYGPITDPSLIMPIGWYNDISGENQEFELFKRSMRIFGYLPSSAYEELYQHCKIILLGLNQHLIRIGDPDDKMYILVTGAVEVYSSRIGPHGDFVRMRTALKCGQIASLFSVVEALTGNARIIKSIFAISKLDATKVIMFPIAAIKDYLVRNQEYLVPSIIRLLERGYRFQYQIMHKAMQLANLATMLDKVPLFDPPNVDIPPPGEALSPKVQEMALRNLMEFLEIDDYDFLKQNCKIYVVEPEPPTNDLAVIKQSILNQPDAAYKYLYFGKLEQYHLKTNLNMLDQQARRKYFKEEIKPVPLIRVCSGEGVGSLTGILGYSNILFCRAVERSIVVTMSREVLEILFQKHPLSILPISYVTIYRMSQFSRAMDFAMEWTVASEGQYIYHKEQMCYNSYLILSGRARAYQLDSESQQRAVLEYRVNDWIGLIESLLQSKRRSKTCVVIRETEFVKIPNDLLRNIVINYSSAAQVMLSFLVRRSLKSRKFELQDMDVEIDTNNYKESRRTNSLALVPAAEALPYSVLALEIKRHYCPWGKCLILTYKKTLAALRMDDIAEKDQFKLEMYILTQMENYDLVIFICLPYVHYWNEVSSSHAEVIFTVGCSQLPNISTIPDLHEEEIVGKKISARRKELIILHSMDVKLPCNTKEWLFCRDWIHFHHHIRLPKEAFNFLGAIPEEELEVKYESLYREAHLTSDLSRFIRWVVGKTFGVLFSSGGSRIGAQLGMLQALLEYKMIPVDMVTGTGAGFLVAACYAVYQDYEKVQEIIQMVFRDSQDLLKFHWDDASIPWISSSKGKRLLTYFSQLFGCIQLEDTWIPICCVTTNLTSQDVRIDRSGPLWLFIRASLSHLNYCPPICDPIDGDYICDGAHANSLPEDIIKEYGAEYIIAFNTIQGKTANDNKADPNISITRFLKATAETFMKQCGLANPAIETVFNDLAVTQTRMYAAGVETVSNLKYVVYVRPPVEHFPSQNWSHLPSLHRIGYFYMKAILDKNPYTEEIPFQVYWTNIKTTSSDMASEGGRDIHLFN